MIEMFLETNKEEITKEESGLMEAMKMGKKGRRPDKTKEGEKGRERKGIIERKGYMNKIYE